MGLLILIMVLSLVVLLPFVWMRRPWAIAIWGRIKLIAVVYAVIILLSGVVRLVFDFDDIYG
jgi:glucose-6-phosphate-specific signal transduction histidine kinase